MAKQQVYLARRQGKSLIAALLASGALDVVAGDELPERPTKPGKSERVLAHAQAKQERKRANRARQAAGGGDD